MVLLPLVCWFSSVHSIEFGLFGIWQLVFCGLSSVWAFGWEGILVHDLCMMRLFCARLRLFSQRVFMFRVNQFFIPCFWMFPWSSRSRSIYYGATRCSCITGMMPFDPRSRIHRKRGATQELFLHCLSFPNFFLLELVHLRHFLSLS